MRIEVASECVDLFRWISTGRDVCLPACVDLSGFPSRSHEGSETGPQCGLWQRGGNRDYSRMQRQVLS